MHVGPGKRSFPIAYNANGLFNIAIACDNRFKRFLHSTKNLHVDSFPFSNGVVANQ